MPCRRRVVCAVATVVFAVSCGVVDRVRHAVQEGRDAIAAANAKVAVFAIQEVLGPVVDTHVGAAIDRAYAARVTELVDKARLLHDGTAAVLVVDTVTPIGAGAVATQGTVAITAGAGAVTAMLDLDVAWSNVIVAGPDGDYSSSGAEAVTGALHAEVIDHGAAFDDVRGTLRLLGATTGAAGDYAFTVTLDVVGGSNTRSGRVAGTPVAGTFDFVFTLDPDGDGVGVDLTPRTGGPLFACPRQRLGGRVCTVYVGAEFAADAVPAGCDRDFSCADGADAFCSLADAADEVTAVVYYVDVTDTTAAVAACAAAGGEFARE